MDISTAAAHLPMPKIGAYGVNKFAFNQWLAHVQRDMADRDVRVHSFHPGAILTDAVMAFGMNKEGVAWDDAHLLG